MCYKKDLRKAQAEERAAQYHLWCVEDDKRSTEIDIIEARLEYEKSQNQMLRAFYTYKKHEMVPS